ncbi:NAD(P)/FAD-dependent oxidoreductase [Spelaeicoccus albus]|uniref:Glycine/D-amino acid oxidase-like deaminating enzyme n=1 Tax=Spelaeicoccus albus TaxID=1280376 RepID=A0A7Z0AAY6_9MICO|nr:FAD-dependent oxidoreductase [Spelaeicoccus albus]NYI66313.1 glycine/D-amino acid oxidase-like deaminating enzyme [Spelaeicoccus albus]
MRNGDVSFWHTGLGAPAPRAQLRNPRQADVAIVGAGFTGLWTAYYLKKCDPTLEVVVLEARFAGYGASGRNGGWVSNAITGGKARYAASHSPAAAEAFQRAMNDSVDQVIAFGGADGTGIGAVKGGELSVATNAAQLGRLRAEYADEARWQSTDVRWLDADETRARVNVHGVRGGMWHPHCARINPGKLVRALAAEVDRLGVPIYENTPVRRIRPRQAITDAGTVEAQYIVRATEGFTAGLKGSHRDWLPMNSSMIATEPLPPDLWNEIGWEGRETLGDAAHAYMYAQRTADDRIAFGGRGKPYLYGSRTDVDGHTPQATIDMLAGLLHRFFPAAADVPIAHAWSGVLGVPRDWAATVGLERRTGLGWAGGYVGTGVTATNLAGRTLRDLILGRDTEIAGLPWVDRRVRRWEIEPLRWVAVNALYSAYYRADKAEEMGSTRTSRFARVADRVSGKA